jgi:outer membrane protein TolC
VIARLDTERSYFQYKDSVQELVRGVIEAYWTLVQARTDVFARKFQVDQSKFALDLAETEQKVGRKNLGDVVQARTTYKQFVANLIAAEANVLTREGALRNMLGLPPDDDRQLVPTSAPTTQRLRPEWRPLVTLAEQRRPDVVELKLIVEADQQRLLQAENQALPKLDASYLYRWNGLDGVAPNGADVSSTGGRFADWSVGLNFSVPLGLRSGRAQVRQQKLIIERDRANVEQSIHAAIADIALTVRNIDSNYEQFLAYKEARAAAFANVEVQIAKYKTGGVLGQTTYLNVLQALNDFGNALSSEAASLIAYNVALATLERQTGTILETHGLVFAEERFRSAGPLGFVGHGRDYPAANFVSGEPTRYPSTGRPGENVFDLRKPDPNKFELPKDAGDVLPLPKVLPPGGQP